MTSVIVCGAIYLMLNVNGQLQSVWPTCAAGGGAERLIDAKLQSFNWPPKLNQQYPDLQLVDQHGTLTRLSDFKGHIILLEPIGMPCKACQAFSGGHHRGGYEGIPPQPGLPSIAEAARTYGGFDLADDRIIKIHLLLYNLDMNAPTADDARAWANHFSLDRANNEIVLAGTPSMICDASYQMIPGLQLIDQDMVLRANSTGRSNQQHDLYRQLLPKVGEMLGSASEFASGPGI